MTGPNSCQSKRALFSKTSETFPLSVSGTFPVALSTGDEPSQISVWAVGLQSSYNYVHSEKKQPYGLGFCSGMSVGATNKVKLPKNLLDTYIL